MKLTQDLIDEIACAMDMRKKNGDPVWEDGDEVRVEIAGTFAADKFIVLKNKTKSPVISSLPMDREHKPHHSK
jgi:hypothetical protein